MAQVSIDRQSLSIDGRRVWLVSGTFNYARVPHELWPARLAEMKHAGLNTVCLPVPWSLHEPRQGRFDFSGDLDLPACIGLAAKLGLWVILRAGPAIDDGWDAGGLPAWLGPLTGGSVRGGHPEYLRACSAWFAALVPRFRELQAGGSRKRSGPVILVQAEHRYHCGSETLRAAYLAELDRFLRENGVRIPIVNCNGLFNTVEGQIDGWAGYGHLHANMRQLRFLRPDQPRLLVSLRAGCPDVWGSPRRNRREPRRLLRQALEALAAGAQFNLDPFFGGTNFGFTGGRLDDGPARFVTTSHDCGAPLDETGRPTEALHAVRRVAMFASHFGKVLAGAEPEYQPAAISPDALAAPVADDETGALAERGKGASAGGAAAIHLKGPQGEVVCIFGDESTKNAATSIVLGDGSTLPIALGAQGVAWMLLGTHLGGQATLDYCNLNPFALVGRLFVCFGPAGAPGLISINGAAVEFMVPSGEGAPPHVESLEGITIIACNESLIDAVQIGAEAVLIGAAGIDANGAPIPHPDHRRITRFGPDGRMTVLPAGAPPRARAGIVLGAWTGRSCDEFTGGDSPRFASIDRPRPLAELGADYGYAWIRARFRPSSAGRTPAAFVAASDRLHLFLDSEPVGIAGLGPGATVEPVPLPLKKQTHTLVALADNLGRFSAGANLAEPKGLFGDVWESRPFRVGALKLEAGRPVSPLELAVARGVPCMGLEEGDATDARRITWAFSHLRKSPLFLCIRAFAAPGVMLLNDEPIHLLGSAGWERIPLPARSMEKGKNILQIAVIGDPEHAAGVLKNAVTLLEGVRNLTEEAEWSFAKWEPPSRWDLPRHGARPSNASPPRKGFPAWWRATLTADSPPRGPVFLKATGLSKGQVFLNGRNVGRYWSATASGRAVPPQEKYYLPECWIRGGENELVIFDEHGFPPERARIIG